MAFRETQSSWHKLNQSSSGCKDKSTPTHLADILGHDRGKVLTVERCGGKFIRTGLTSYNNSPLLINGYNPSETTYIHHCQR